MARSAADITVMGILLALGVAGGALATFLRTSGDDPTDTLQALFASLAAVLAGVSARFLLDRGQPALATLLLAAAVCQTANLRPPLAMLLFASAGVNALFAVAEQWWQGHAAQRASAAPATPPAAPSGIADR